MTQIPLWFERRFDFSFPVEHYPNICIRLLGTPARMEELLRGIAKRALVAKPGEKWAAQEHAGHLLDMGPLWLGRVEDFVSEKDTLTVADLSNRKTEEANHNAKDLSKILAEFRKERMSLLNRVEGLSADNFGRTLLHPRLKQPMRLVDHLYFVAEHDDHHLARIREIIR